MIAAALVPLWAGAAEVSDTTFTVNGKDIVVDVDGDKTNVKVYNKSGVEETKVSEMNFVDGQEYERCMWVRRSSLRQVCSISTMRRASPRYGSALQTSRVV